MRVLQIARRGNAHGVTIPRAYLRQLHWAQGDWVVLEIEGAHLKVSSISQLAARVRYDKFDSRSPANAPPQD